MSVPDHSSRYRAITKTEHDAIVARRGRNYYDDPVGHHTAVRRHHDAEASAAVTDRNGLTFNRCDCGTCEGCIITRSVANERAAYRRGNQRAKERGYVRPDRRREG